MAIMHAVGFVLLLFMQMLFLLLVVVLWYNSLGALKSLTAVLAEEVLFLNFEMNHIIKRSS